MESSYTIDALLPSEMVLKAEETGVKKPNMYFIPIGLFIQSGAGQDFWKVTGVQPEQFTNLTASHFFSTTFSLLQLLYIWWNSYDWSSVLVCVFERKKQKTDSQNSPIFTWRVLWL